MTCPTYLINLDRSVDRLCHAKQQLDGLGMLFERVPAAIGYESLTVAERERIELDSIAATGIALNAGEIGCYLSHMKCLTEFLATNAEFCLVLEDDLEIRAEGVTTLRSLLDRLQNKEIPSNFNVINLGNRHKKLHTEIASVGAADNVVTLANSHHFPFKTTGLLWSRSGAEKFIRECENICRPVDVQLQWWVSENGGGWAFDRVLVNAGGYESEIYDANPRFKKTPLKRRIERKQHKTFLFRGIINLIRFRISRGKSC